MLLTLISAAPELYLALKKMVHLFDRNLAEGTIGREACDEATKALEKASAGVHVHDGKVMNANGDFIKSI